MHGSAHVRGPTTVATLNANCIPRKRENGAGQERIKGYPKMIQFFWSAQTSVRSGNESDKKDFTIEKKAKPGTKEGQIRSGRRGGWAG